MKMVADMVSSCDTLADIGCDHGYLSIWLLRNGICKKAVAMDLREGPLKHAEGNRRFFHMEERMELRLSDGLAKLEPEEADAIVCAGMGGQLVIDILRKKPECTLRASQLILQPQSEIAEVRRYLHHIGFRIEDEEMCFEDGKFYTVMKAVPGREDAYSEEEYLAGKCLIAKKHPVACIYMKEQVEKRKKVLQELEKASVEKAAGRREGAQSELEIAVKALERLCGTVQ